MASSSSSVPLVHGTSSLPPQAQPSPVHQAEGSSPRGLKLVYIKIGALLHHEEHVRNIVEMAVSVNDIVIALFESVADNAEKVGHILELILNGAHVFGFINDVKWWVSVKAHSVYETISKIFLTTYKGIKSTIFFSQLGAFSLSKIAINIGRIPVIGLVVNVLGIAGYGVHLIQSVKEYRQASRELEGLKKTYEGLKAFSLLSDDKTDALQIMEKKIKAQKILVYSAKVEIIDNVAYILFAALTILAFSTGWGALAMTGALMISLSVTTTLIWVYNCYLSEKNKKVLDEPVINPYRQVAIS